jgi:hypothetical protein
MPRTRRYREIIAVLTVLLGMSAIAGRTIGSDVECSWTDSGRILPFTR